MTTEDLRRLFEHLWWADARVQETQIGLGAPPPAALELHAHVLGAELVWLDRIQGTTSGADVWPASDASAVRELARRARQGANPNGLHCLHPQRAGRHAAGRRPNPMTVESGSRLQ